MRIGVLAKFMPSIGQDQCGAFLENTTSGIARDRLDQWICSKLVITVDGIWNMCVSRFVTWSGPRLVLLHPTGFTSFLKD